MLFHTLTPQREDLARAFIYEFEKALKADCKRNDRDVLLPYVLYEHRGDHMTYSGCQEYHEKLDSFLLSFTEEIRNRLRSETLRMGAAALTKKLKAKKRKKSRSIGGSNGGSVEHLVDG
ncbi:MAG: hypothetical protein Q8K86_00240 [Candidatus Nanopelagicaceae bacterium]|nr:hypothetical protein [Candidatus Nanopelagicaceae bacterium]